jgi:hypothetical protein
MCPDVDAASDVWESDRRRAADVFRQGIVALQASMSGRQ